MFRSDVKRCDGRTLHRMPLGPDNDPVWSYVCDSADVVRLRHAGHSWTEIAAELGTGDPDLMRRLYELRQQGGDLTSTRRSLSTNVRTGRRH